MNIIEIYNPTFSVYHETPIVTWKEPKTNIRVATNMFDQYKRWLNAWTDPFRDKRDKHAPGDAFWQSAGPQICRALRYFDARALVFDYETDRKVSYRWFARTPGEVPTSYKGEWYSICPVYAEVSRSGEAHVTVTLPTDEDVSLHFHSSSMQAWLKPKPKPEPVEQTKDAQP